MLSLCFVPLSQHLFLTSMWLGASAPSALSLVTPRDTLLVTLPAGAPLPHYSRVEPFWVPSLFFSSWVSFCLRCIHHSLSLSYLRTDWMIPAFLLFSPVSSVKTGMARVLSVECPCLAWNPAYRWCSVNVCRRPAGVLTLPMKKWTRGKIEKFAKVSAKTNSHGGGRTSLVQLKSFVRQRLFPGLEAVAEKTASCQSEP